MEIQKEIFGKMADDRSVYLFTMINENGMSAKISNFGATLVSLRVPDRNNKFDDVVLGYDNLQDYIEGEFFFGAVIGRNANRIKNAEIKIDSKKYKLTENEGKNQLHGGTVGFDKVLWTPRISINDNGEQCIEMTYMSKDGEEGYPGNLEVRVQYCICRNNELRISYHAICDKDTVVNLTNHSYFNLSGHSQGDILNHEVMINSNKFTANDIEGIPTGEIRDVENTPMDFRKRSRVCENINKDYDQLTFAGGYDNNWILEKGEKDFLKAAEVFENSCGRLMEVYTTEPGIQFYTGNNIKRCKGCKENAAYYKYSGLCFETQHFPDALHHKCFPSTILRMGRQYSSTTKYKFKVE